MWKVERTYKERYADRKTNRSIKCLLNLPQKLEPGSSLKMKDDNELLRSRRDSRRESRYVDPDPNTPQDLSAAGERRKGT
jgi:hypothetical protein